MMKSVIQQREYKVWQSCALCSHPMKKCIFYRCECGHISYKLCEECSYPSKAWCIKRCPFCTTAQEARQNVNFSTFLPFKYYILFGIKKNVIVL